MRLIGLVISLGLIGWVVYQAAGGGKAETVIPVEHRKALDKAQGLEQSLQEATQKSMQELEENQF
jgi:hypothetical protein